MDSDTRDLHLQVHLAEYARTHQEQVEYIKLQYQMTALAAVIFAAGLTLIGALSSSQSALPVPLQTAPSAPVQQASPASILLLCVPFALYSVLFLQVWLDTQLHMHANYIDCELHPRIQRLLGTDDFWHLESYHLAYEGPGRPFFRWWAMLVLWIPLLLACILLIAYGRLTGLTSASPDYPVYSLNWGLVPVVFLISLLVMLVDHWWGWKEHARLKQYRTALQYHASLEHRTPGPSLARFDLARRDLEGVVFTGADLREANLEDANLRGARLAGANLQCSNLRKTNLEQAELSGANLSSARLWRARLAGATLDADTVMPDGWHDVVVTKALDGPPDGSVETPREREHDMEAQVTWSHTVTGKPFAYEGDLSSGLVVYPTGDDWKELSGGRVEIPGEGIRFIRREIQSARLVAMGACRDNPARGSLGEKLKRRGSSPQWLSYVVPLLREDGFCDAFKQGRGYVVRYTGP